MFSGNMVFVLLILGIVLLMFYVHPYQKATGMLTENGNYLVWSGELGLSLGFGALLMGGGLFAYRSIRSFCR